MEVWIRKDCEIWKSARGWKEVARISGHPFNVAAATIFLGLSYRVVFIRLSSLYSGFENSS